jgi:hypothetical protein
VTPSATMSFIPEVIIRNFPLLFFTAQVLSRSILSFLLFPSFLGI